MSVKEFGKVKIYMLYQDQFKISNEEMEKLSSELGELREQEKELNDEVKEMGGSIRALQARPRFSDLKKEEQSLEH